MKFVRKFCNGRLTPQEFHAEHAFPPDAKCTACGKRPTIVARVLMPLDELRKRDPLFDVMADRDPGGMLALLVHTKFGAYVRTTTAYACPACEKELDKTLAKAPSWAIIEKNCGPDPTNRVVVGAE